MYVHNRPDDFIVKVLMGLVPKLRSGARVVIQDNGLADLRTIGLSDELIQRYVKILPAANILTGVFLVVLKT